MDFIYDNFDGICASPLFQQIYLLLMYIVLPSLMNKDKNIIGHYLQEDGWTQKDPFVCEIRDEKIWGRGSTDDKVCCIDFY